MGPARAATITESDARQISSWRLKPQIEYERVVTVLAVRALAERVLGSTGAGGAVMRAVIVCESMFGSTKKVAVAIAEG